MTIFTKATKRQSKLRMAVVGPSGSGKTYTSLLVGTVLANGGRVAVIDTERGSASKYAHRFEFDVLELDSFEPENYIRAIEAAEAAGYDVLIIDSLSHAWAGTGGILEFVDTETLKSKSRNAYTDGWRKATPKHNALVEAMLQSRVHLIATMRSKTEYVIDEDDKGRKAPRKIGMQPVQRDGLEYEFDVVGDMDLDNNYVVSKTRCEDLTGKMFARPGKDLAEILRAWLSDGAIEAPRAHRPPEPPKRPSGSKAPPAPPGNGSNGKLSLQEARAVVPWPEAPEGRPELEGATLGELEASKPQVVDWLADDGNAGTPRIAQAARCVTAARGGNGSMSLDEARALEMPFGVKNHPDYKGKSLGDVEVADPGCIDWLAKTARSADLKAAAMAIAAARN